MCNSKKRKTVRSLIYSLMVLSVVSCGLKKEEQPADPQEQEEDGCRYEYGICVDSLNVTRFEIGRGQYLASIFSGLGFTATESEKIIESLSPLYPPSKLQVGSSYAAITDTTSAVKYVVFEKSPTDYAIVDLSEQTMQVYEYTKPVTLKRAYVEANITSSLWNAIIETGAPALLALKLSDVYAWQIDFFDIKKGDSFRLMYDMAYIDDTTMVGISSIEGAVFSHQGKKYPAIPFRQDTVSEYFDESGNSLRKAFLKAPLDFIRISSRFSNARYHPVLKRYRPHHGVDYAAPTGTPVKTIGDGVVIEKAFQRGGAGNYLKVKHNATYTTTYMHLSRFAKGLGKGSRVKQGEVIGYVGSTGLSTGPHLDFRVYKHNQPVNPLTIESPPSLPVKPELMDRFLYAQRQVMHQLDSLQAIHHPTATKMEALPLIATMYENYLLPDSLSRMLGGPFNAVKIR